MRKTVPLTIRIYEDSRTKILPYYFFIERHIKNGDKIPARVLKEFLSFIQFDNSHVVNEKRASELLDLCVSRFEDDEDYKIEGYTIKQSYEPPLHLSDAEPKNLKGKAYRQHYNLQTLFEEVINSTFKITREQNETKENVVPVVYSLIVRYRDLMLNAAHRKFITDYKCRAMTGYLASIIVGRITHMQPISNEVLQDSVRYYIKKHKNKKP